MKVFFSLLFHVGLAGVAMFFLLAIIAGATSKVGAASMGPVLLGIAIGDLLICGLALWFFCRRAAALGASVLPWGITAGVLLLGLLLVMGFVTLVATNR